MTKNVLLLTCATGALSVWAGAAQAATAAAQAQAGSTVSEIVVVAEHRETPIQKIPVAVSVFTGKQRDTIGINTVQDVTNFAPGFTYDTITTHPYIRGVGRQSINVTDDERVASYEDEFFVYTAYELKQSSLFLTQEQIQRGPQNVGGRNAAAGSIDMISVRPTEHPYAELRATLGSYGLWNIEGAASDQIAPGLTARIAGSYLNQEDGYYTNLARRQTQGDLIHEWYVQGQVNWKINDRANLWVKGFWSEWNNNQGDAGARAAYQTGSFDLVNLMDPSSELVGSIMPNPNYGLAAVVPSAAAGHNPADQLPISVTLGNPGVLNNPALINVHDFTSVDPKDRTINLKNYRGIQSNFTYDFNGWQLRYITGIQGYDYDADIQDGGNNTFGNSNVISFTLPGGAGNCAALASPFTCAATVAGLGFLPGVLPANAATLNAVAAKVGANGNLVVNPTVNWHYTEDDYWWSHELTFQSTGEGPLQWEFGAWYYKQHYTQPSSFTDAGQPQLAHPSNLIAFLAATGAFAPIVPLPPAFGALATDPGLVAALGPAGAAGLAGLLSGVTNGITTAGIAPNPNHYVDFAEYGFDVQSIAGYGQMSYKFNDQWKFTGNIRYSDDTKTGFEKARIVEFAPQGLVEFLGPNTPAFDLTSVATCPTGNGVAGTPACNGGPLAPGVKSIGVLDPATGIESRQLSGGSSAVTGGAGVEYTPNEDIFVYARYGRGYEDITFNAGGIAAHPLVSPEFLNAYEVGYKQNLGGKLMIDAAVYYYDYSQLQLPVSAIVGGRVTADFVNAPKSLSSGFELEAYWTPTKNWSFTLSYSYDYTAVLTKCFGTVTKGALTPAPGSFCLVDTNDPDAVAPGANPFPGQTPGQARLQGVNGAPLPDAPRNKLAINVAYTFNFEPGDLTLSGAFVYRSEQDGNLFNRFYNNAPDWNGLDLRALWRGPKDKYEVIGYIRNVTNAPQYTVGALGGGNGLRGDASKLYDPAVGLNWTNTYDLAPPRTYGVEFRYKFF
jgi:iron complex outermembrane receptor protein